MTKTVRRTAGTPLSDEALKEIRNLAHMPDCEIDISDIPERISFQTATDSSERLTPSRSDKALIDRAS